MRKNDFFLWVYSFQQQQKKKIDSSQLILGQAKKDKSTELLVLKRNKFYLIDTIANEKNGTMAKRKGNTINALTIGNKNRSWRLRRTMQSDESKK